MYVIKNIDKQKHMLFKRKQKTFFTSMEKYCLEGGHKINAKAFTVNLLVVVYIIMVMA